MMVCAHGKVTEFCEKRDMVICDEWNGDLRDYDGPCCIVVTDSDISENEYYFLKGELLVKGIELISTRHKDKEGLIEFLMYANNRRKTRRSGGRQKFCDEAVIGRIMELREEGLSLRSIREDEKVRHPDGRKLSISTISNIIRSKKENG